MSDIYFLLIRAGRWYSLWAWISTCKLLCSLQKNNTFTPFLHFQLCRYLLSIHPGTHSCPHTPSVCWAWQLLGIALYDAVAGRLSWALTALIMRLALSVPVNPLNLQLHDLTFASKSSSVPGRQTHTHTKVFEKMHTVKLYANYILLTNGHMKSKRFVFSIFLKALCNYYFEKSICLLS